MCVYASGRTEQVEAHDYLFSRIELETVAPSKSALAVWRRRREHAKRKARVLEHCKLAPSGSKARIKDGPLRIGFLGHPVPHKGWPVFHKIAAKHLCDPRYEFFRFGQHDTAETGVKFRKVVVTAENASAMIEAIDDSAIDLAVIWSLWPETFCLTAYEAHSGGAAIATCAGSGNVASLASTVGGRVFGSESELEAAFESGELSVFARKLRNPERQVMVYSRMSADLI